MLLAAFEICCILTLWWLCCRGRFYPGTGGVDEVGAGAGEGYTINIPWDARDMGNGDYISAFTSVLIPIAYEYNPDLIIISAGFDAAEGDPIGECRVTPECYAHMTALLKAVAPVVLLLEGGYNLKSTAASTEACLRVMLGEQPPCLPGNRYASYFGQKAIHSAILTQSAYWKSMRALAYSLMYQQSAMSKMVSQTYHPAGPTATTVPAQPQSLSTSTGRKSTREDAAAPSSGANAASKKIKKRKKQQKFLSRKRQVLMAIHRRALRAFWKRQKRIARQHAVAA